MKKLLTLASLLVLAGSLGADARIVGSAPSYALARSYATGSGPGAVAIGDLNSDGSADLVTANVNEATASVLLNSGDGSFQARRDYRTGHAPSGVAIADLNEDSWPDLAIANNFDGTVSVLLNSGGGSFQTKVDYATGSYP